MDSHITVDFTTVCVLDSIERSVEIKRSNHIETTILQDIQNSLKFNSKKSRAIVFTNKRSIAWKETDFSICGEHLSEVREVTHLGHVLSSVIASSTASVKERCRKFYSCLYSIMGSVKGISTDPDVWSTVMDRVLLPVLGYGLGL